MIATKTHLATPRRATLVALGLCAALAPAHGIFEKPLYSNKTNAATRGRAGGGATSLFMMQPPLYLSGPHQTIGWRIKLQDEDASTAESITLRYVRYAANGRDPDLSAAGELLKTTVQPFGRGDSGVKAYSLFISVGIPVTLPRNFGLALDLPANAKWPQDGLSLHSQLNLPGDSRRPRVPAPHDKQVWAFERPAATSKLTPLGGRSLDVLEITGVYIEPTLQTYVRTTAYGLGREEIFGPEAMHPSAARGDEFGFFVNGGQIGSGGIGLILAGPKLAPKALNLGFNRILVLDPTSTLPAPVHAVVLDGLGQAKTRSWPISALPAAYRSFWAQAVIYQTFTGEFELSDAVGIRGL